MGAENSLQDVVRCYFCDSPCPPMKCTNCNIKLCTTCVENHLSDHKHKVVSCKQRRSTAICLKHPSKICALYCVQCEFPICDQCASSEKHKRHEFYTINNKNELKTENIEKNYLNIYKKNASNVSVQETDLNEKPTTSTTAIRHKHVESSPPEKSHTTDTPAAAVLCPKDESFKFNTTGAISPFSDRQLAKDVECTQTGMAQSLNSSCAVSISPKKTSKMNDMESASNNGHTVDIPNAASIPTDESCIFDNCRSRSDQSSFSVRQLTMNTPDAGSSSRKTPCTIYSPLALSTHSVKNHSMDSLSSPLYESQSTNSSLSLPYTLSVTNTLDLDPFPKETLHTLNTPFALTSTPDDTHETDIIDVSSSSLSRGYMLDTTNALAFPPDETFFFDNSGGLSSPTNRAHTMNTESSPKYTPQSLNFPQTLSSLSNEMHGMVTQVELVSPQKTILNVPQIIRHINTKHNGKTRSVSCLDDGNIWVCGNSKMMRLYDIKGKLVKSVQTKSGNIPQDMASDME